ncbi:hypothetical protein HPB51_001495 [Rhipicephalus microplus]|uniref:Uncharacterized protein n=1 Tax=Rhipicephalus microplus TaxID=6941 RepID=A0A9J6EW27_RHIMP|nr:hypothetical protein HPB51_001495 [Rhipicephalus microplus]
MRSAVEWKSALLASLPFLETPKRKRKEQETLGRSEEAVRRTDGADIWRMEENRAAKSGGEEECARRRALSARARDPTSCRALLFWRAPFFSSAPKGGTPGSAAERGGARLCRVAPGLACTRSPLRIAGGERSLPARRDITRRAFRYRRRWLGARGLRPPSLPPLLLRSNNTLAYAVDGAAAAAGVEFCRSHRLLLIGSRSEQCCAGALAQRAGSDERCQNGGFAAAPTTGCVATASSDVAAAVRTPARTSVAPASASSVEHGQRQRRQRASSGVYRASHSVQGERDSKGE